MRQRERQEPGARVHTRRPPRTVTARRIRRVRSLGHGGGDVPRGLIRSRRESKRRRRRERSVAKTHRRPGTRGGHLVRRAGALQADPDGERVELILASVRVCTLGQAPLYNLESIRRLARGDGGHVDSERRELLDRGDHVPQGTHAVRVLVIVVVAAAPVGHAVEHSLGSGDGGVVGGSRREQVFARNLRDDVLGNLRRERGWEPVRGATGEVARGVPPELGCGGAEATHQSP